MNLFVYACIKYDGGYATKCTVAYSQKERIKHFDFLVHAIKEWPLSICLILKLFLRRINGRIFERILLEYLFHVLAKAKISSQDMYVSNHFKNILTRYVCFQTSQKYPHKICIFPNILRLCQKFKTFYIQKF